MRIIRHQDHIRRRKRQARLFAFLGFIILTSSLLIAWYPDRLLFAYVAMLAGFILFNMGMQQLGKWSRTPRNDQLLDHYLKSLGDRYTVVHYAPVGKTRIEHLIVHPGGVLVVTAREIDGIIEQRGPRWRRKGGLFRRLFGFSGPQLGNPSFETDAAVNAVRSYLEREQLEVDVEGAIAFLHPKVELDVQEPDYPVLFGDELAGFVQGLPADVSFSREERDRLLEMLAAGGGGEQPQPAAAVALFADAPPDPDVPWQQRRPRSPRRTARQAGLSGGTTMRCGSCRQRFGGASVTPISSTGSTRSASGRWRWNAPVRSSVSSRPLLASPVMRVRHAVGSAAAATRM